ncbi:unnamed protein product [Oppiella nova]|uniref:Uncharacterized protein n=1 Tax=Oppiella nova TaxID=334625 RepID=A0A7R9M3K1_9ACAR|nr:unnamed protein product [Oppiella nova]CAG2168961.1 unnamed protein product [Oppiella nova]
MEKQTSKLVNKAKPHIKALLGKDSRNNKESGNIFEKKLDFIYFRDNDSNHRKIITLLNGLSKDTALNALVLKFNGMVLARQSVRDDSSTDKVLYIKEIVESLPVKLEKTIKIFIFDIFSKAKESWRDFSKFMTRFEEVFSKILAKHAVNHHLGQICEKVYQELKALLGANGCPDIHVFGIGQTSELYLCPVY